MSYDPWEFADEIERNDWAVRDQLRAKRILADIETGKANSKERVRQMLAAVNPGPRVCGQVGSRVDGKPGKVCGKPGVRLIRLSGTWCCEEHDPLRRPAPPTTGCCGLTEIVLCRARQGAWECTAGIVGHAWPHHFMRLRGDE